MRAPRVLAASLALARTTTTMASSCDSPRVVPFVLYGAGGVGSALLDAIVGARSLHADRYGIRFAATAVCDSSAAVSGAAAGGGLSDEELAAIIAHKAAGDKLSTLTNATKTVRDSSEPAEDFLRKVAEKHGEEHAGTIVVDVRACPMRHFTLTLAALPAPLTPRPLAASRRRQRR